MKKLLNISGQIIGFIYNPKINLIFKKIIILLREGYYKRKFKDFGKGVIIESNIFFLGTKFISIGNNVRLGRNGTLTAWEKFNDDNFSPVIIINENVSIGDQFHITSINSINIGKNVLMGQKITITDNSHGLTDKASMILAPRNRKLISKGRIVINNDVWIGDKVTIVGNIEIGNGSIIASNSVVTKNIPDYTVVGGIPAKIIKQYK